MPLTGDERLIYIKPPRPQRDMNLFVIDRLQPARRQSKIWDTPCSPLM
jgi:hypothetical protein